MAKRPRTANQLANDQRLRDAAAARRQTPTPVEPVQATTPTPPAQEDDDFISTDFQESVPDNSELLRQIKEIQETNALLKAALLGQSQQPAQGGINTRSGKLIGETERYLVDPSNYDDPTPRLAKEPRLQAVNFNYNYELDYRMDIVSYETKTGLNMKEPKFVIALNRVVLNDQGEQTDKRYIAKRLVFHEDPQAAIVVARENGLPIDESNEKDFLNEMRYLRVRDWLFGVFWPKPADEAPQIREEVIGGTIVQVFTKASENPSEVEFDKLQTKF